MGKSGEDKIYVAFLRIGKYVSEDFITREGFRH